MENAFFLIQIKRTNGTVEKGVVVKNTGTPKQNQEAAQQSYHAYLGAYAYGNNAQTDYVQVMIIDASGAIYDHETWKAVEEVV